MEEVSAYYPFRKTNYIEPVKEFNDLSISKEDREIIKKLAYRKAEIAAKSIQQEKISLWKKLNTLKQVRPLIWINEIPWHEMNYDDELTLQTSTEFTRFLETRLRRVIYCWEHMPVDMVVEDTMPCYLVLNIDNFGFGSGVEEELDVAITDSTSDVYSRKFIPHFKDENDIEKLTLPKVEVDFKKTDDIFEAMSEVFDGILTVEKRGLPGFWFAPWDDLIALYGIQEGLQDLILKPDYIHKLMDKLMDAYTKRLGQLQELGALALNNGNYRIGSGALGYTDELPQKDFDGSKVRPRDMWGSSAAQIFVAVSPKMHEDFSIRYEAEWLKNFGLNYYGCCEPLDRKIDILKKIPNLRKISMSPWVDLKLGADSIGRDYVYSHKPSPSIFADSIWDINHVKKKFKDELHTLKDCVVEVIMKDISTVRYKPQRLWDWAKIAMEAAEEIV